MNKVSIERSLRIYRDEIFEICCRRLQGVIYEVNELYTSILIIKLNYIITPVTVFHSAT